MLFGLIVLARATVPIWKTTVTLMNVYEMYWTCVEVLKAQKSG